MMSIAIVLISCTGESVQKSDLADHAGRYNAIDLSHLDVTLASPESFIVDEASGCYFVSNVNGASDTKDDNGFIIKLDSNFNLIDNYFIDGRDDAIDLHTPKGMVVSRGVLYVCDLDTVRGFSSETGAHLFDSDFTPLGATFLNGITADSAGNLYVSDTYQNKIYRVDTNGYLSMYAEISFPNGLCLGPDGALYVVTWEAGRRLLFLEDARIFRIQPDGLVNAMWFTTEFENLDGVDLDDAGRLVFSDYGHGVVYAFEPTTGMLAKIAEGIGTPAGISCDRSRGLILIPDLQGSIAVLKWH